MKIAFISSLNGGVGTYTIELVRELSKYVEQIDMYLFSSYKRIPASNLPKNVRIVLHQKSGISLLINLLFSINRLKEYDLIHLNYASFFIPIFILKLIRNVPCIYTSHDAPAPELVNYPAKISRIFEVINLKLSSKYLDMHVTISHHSRKKLQERYKVSPEIVIYHGVDYKKFKFDENKRKIIREKLCLDENDFLILFVGILYRHKNVITLVDAIPHILKHNNNVKLLIIGRGDQLEEIKNRIKELKIEDFIIMKDYVVDINAYFSAADLFAFPSTNEGFGLVLVEAMASGLPIIVSSACSACLEVVDYAGLVFEPKNSEDLADKIIKLINNKKYTKKLRVAGLKRIRRFTWDIAAKKYYEIYRTVLRGSR